MITQTIFAAPMIGLYLLGIVIAWIVGPKSLIARFVTRFHCNPAAVDSHRGPAVL